MFGLCYPHREEVTVTCWFDTECTFWFYPVGMPGQEPNKVHLGITCDGQEFQVESLDNLQVGDM